MTYDSSLFLEKNKDFIIQELVTVMRASTSSFVSGLFANYDTNVNTKTPSVLQKLQNSSSQSSFKFKSVSSQFKVSSFICLIPCRNHFQI